LDAGGGFLGGRVAGGLGLVDVRLGLADGGVGGVDGVLEVVDQLLVAAGGVFVVFVGGEVEVDAFGGLGGFFVPAGGGGAGEGCVGGFLGGGEGLGVFFEGFAGDPVAVLGPGDIGPSTRLGERANTAVARSPRKSAPRPDWESGRPGRGVALPGPSGITPVPTRARDRANRGLPQGLRGTPSHPASGSQSSWWW